MMVKRPKAALWMASLARHLPILRSKTLFSLFLMLK
jgi:hypothetical protein